MNYKMFKKIKRIIKEQKGISSLLEIIAIVTILSILVAASIVSYKGAKSRALIRASCGVLHEIRHAIEVYRIEDDYYPSGVTDFNTLYTKLSPSGLDTDPSEEFSGFVSYSNTQSFYTLVVRARGPDKVYLTATPKGITAGLGGVDYSDLAR